MLKRSEAPSKSPDLVGEDVTGDRSSNQVFEDIIVK